MKIGIGAIFKNEYPYILEWISFHRAMGIDQFFIADNNSNDGSYALLNGLDRAGIVNYIPFPHVEGDAPQLPAYRAIMDLFGGSVDWMAFIDADEFLVPMGSHSSVPAAISRLEDDPGVGAIALNWATFGSSHLSSPDGRPVIERFRYRGPQNWGTNGHYKSIVRTAAYLNTHANPHLFRLKNGYRTVHADGHDVVDGERGPGLSAKIVWSDLRINHYVVKSREEFFERKRKRGRATIVNTQRDDRFFDNHDRNDELDNSVTLAVIEKTKSGIDALVERIKIADLRNDAVVSRPNSQNVFRGAMDEISLEGSSVVVRGWAASGNGSPVSIIRPKSGSNYLESFTIERMHRADVISAVGGTRGDLGFRIRFPVWELSKADPEREMISLWGRVDADGEDVRVSNMSLRVPFSGQSADDQKHNGGVPASATRGANFFKELRHLNHRFKDVRVIFDVGANVGQTAREAMKTFPSADIYCFEPSPNAYRKLVDASKSWPLVQCFNLALGDGEASSLYISDEAESVNNRIIREGEVLLSQKVAAAGGANFCIEKGIGQLDLLKIDTEGYELDVLKGFEGMLRNGKISALLIEAGMNAGNTKHADIVSLLRYLRAFNYDLFGVYEQVRELNSGTLLRRANIGIVWNG